MHDATRHRDATKKGKALATVQQIDPGTRRFTQNIVYSLARSIRERDIITYEHSRRVAVYVYRLARHLGLARRASRDLALAALVHDLGKTWIQNDVLHKDSALSSDERHAMEQHPRVGARFLQVYGAPAALVEIVMHHHETYDGRGYPDRLAGEAIPFGARVLTVADVFDALTSERSYKCAMDMTTARAIVENGIGTHFDPTIARAFLELLDGDPNFTLPSRLCPLPVRSAPHPTWVRHDSIYDF